MFSPTVPTKLSSAMRSHSGVCTGVGQLGDASEDIGAPSLRVDVVELGSDDEGVHRRGLLAAAVGDRGAHPREAVDEHAEERAVSEADQRRDVDAVEERPGQRDSVRNQSARGWHQGTAIRSAAGGEFKRRASDRAT